MGHLSDDDPLDRYDERSDLTDPMDDGSMPLAPMQFDPLCELRGEPYPRDADEAAGFEYEITQWMHE